MAQDKNVEITNITNQDVFFISDTKWVEVRSGETISVDPMLISDLNRDIWEVQKKGSKKT